MGGVPNAQEAIGHGFLEALQERPLGHLLRAILELVIAEVVHVD
jgi:hypothetical protein